MAKGFWIVNIEVIDPVLYDAYRDKAAVAVRSFGGSYLIRGGTATTPEGRAHPRHVVIEFPDVATARACYDSSAYQTAAALRRRAATTDFTIVEGA